MTVTWTEPTATDNSGMTPTVTQTHQPGDSFNVGTTTVTYTFTDMAGNQALCSFTVTVTTDTDTTPPVIANCPNPINIIIPVGTTSITVPWTEPTATDNSGMTPTITQSHQPGTDFPVGTTQVTYTFTDMAGNQAQCSFTVTVTTGTDTTPPVIANCPNPIDIIIPVGTTSMTVSWTEPTATDNSGMTPTITQSHQPGTDFPVGTTQVTYTFTDMAGNQAQCSFTVTVTTGTDTTPPVIANCPNPIDIIIPVGTTSMTVSWTEPTATDNSGMTPTITQSHQPGTDFPVGTTQVTYTFTDMAGNQAQCSFTVTVTTGTDTTPPVIANCPNPIDIIIPVGTTSMTVSWTEPTATDNSGMTPTVTQSINLVIASMLGLLQSHIHLLIWEGIRHSAHSL